VLTPEMEILLRIPEEIRAALRRSTPATTAF
jgi:hypothetical protein